MEIHTPIFLSLYCGRTPPRLNLNQRDDPSLSLVDQHRDFFQQQQRPKWPLMGKGDALPLRVLTIKIHF